LRLLPGPEQDLDRPLDADFRRRRFLKRTGLSLGVVALFARIRTARVDAGPIEAVISTSGTVVPEIEEVVSSPVDARVVHILEPPGAELKAGQPMSSSTRPSRRSRWRSWRGRAGRGARPRRRRRGGAVRHEG